MAPHLNEFKGACSERGRYKLELLTEGFPTPRDIRNIMKMLELTALWLEEDEGQERTLSDVAGNVPASKPYAPSIEPAAEGSNACGDTDIADATPAVTHPNGDRDAAAS